MISTLRTVLSLVVGLVLFASAADAGAQDAALEAGYELLASGHVAEAEAVFQELSDASPSYGAPVAGLAAVAAARGEWALAVGFADRALALDETIPVAATLRCRGLVAVGRLSDASPACIRAIELDDTDPTAYASLCASYVGRYRWYEAVTWCGAGAELAPDVADLQWRLGVALTNSGDVSRGLAACDAAMRLAPGAPMPQYCRGAALLAQDRFSDALTACGGMQAADQHPLLLYCRGMANLGLSNVDAAERACSDAVTRAPQEALGHFCLGRIDRELGANEAAAEHLTRAVAYNERLFAARGSLGEVLTRAGQLEEGERWLRDAYGEEPSGDRAAQLGTNLFLQGRYDDALALFEDAVNRSPTDARFHHNLAGCYRELGRLDEMYAALEAAVAASPGDPRWSVYLADAALRFGDYGRALGAANDGLERHPSSGGLHSARCSAAVRLQSTGVTAVCTRAAELLPTDPSPRMMLGVALIQQGDAEAAEVALRAAASLGADDALLHFNLGSARAGQGDLAAAAASFRTAIARDATLAAAHYQLGRVLDASGDADGARRAFCAARDAAPGDARYAEACP